MSKVFETKSFEKEISALSKKEKDALEKIKDQLESSYKTGKVLRYPFFREKKIRNKRVYFLKYEDLDAVLLVAISDKKSQKETIDKIAELIPEFKKYMKRII